jgi:uncharacterized lipoprotein YajG
MKVVVLIVAIVILASCVAAQTSDAERMPVWVG